MNDDPKDFRSRATSFLQETHKQFIDTVRRGRETISAAPQSFFEKYPQLENRANTLHESVKQNLEQGRSVVAKRVDEEMGKLGVLATNFGRENVKFKENPNDWFPTRYQKRAFNFGVDVLADNLETISRGAQDFGSGIKQKIGPNTLDRIHPRHLKTLFENPEDTKRYFSQRKDQVMQIFDLYNNPKEFAGKKWDQAKNSFYNVAERVSEMDSGVSNKIRHGGRVFVDMAQEKIAPALGVGMGIFALYNLRAQQRKGTRDKMDSLFPKKKLHGKAFRVFPVRMMFTKPLARVLGNPRLSAFVLAYSLATGIGKSIEDSKRLQKILPETFKRLKGREMYKSSSQLDAHESIVRTSQAKK